MLRSLRKIHGQSTLEYILLIIVILAMLLAMQGYMKKGGMQAIKQSIDDLSGGKQYSPHTSTYTKSTKSDSLTRETVDKGVTASELIKDDSTNETENLNTEMQGEVWDR